MKKVFIFIFVILLAAQSNIYSADTSFNVQTFTQNVFNELDKAKKDYAGLSNQEKEKASNQAYAGAITKIIARAAVLNNSATQQELLSALQDKLIKDFGLLDTAETAREDAADNNALTTSAQTVIEEALEKYEGIPNAYIPGAAQAVKEIKERGEDSTSQVLLIDALKEYLTEVFAINSTIDDAFNKNAKIEDAAQVILAPLTQKNVLEARITINALIDALINRMNTSMSPDNTDVPVAKKNIQDQFQNKTGLQDVINATTDTIKSIKDYSAFKKNVSLNTIRKILIAAVNPPPPSVEATVWVKPPHREWYEKWGDAMHVNDWFSGNTWNNVIGGALKVGFVDNLYEGGLMWLARKFNNNVMQKPRDVAHAIAKALRKTADTLANTPTVISTGAAPIIGGKGEDGQQKETLDKQLQDGVKEINENIANIRVAITKAQEYKPLIANQHLASIGIKELKDLNTILLGDTKTVGVFDELIGALNELVGPNCATATNASCCATGALCGVQDAMNKSVKQAISDENNIKQNIEELNKMININHPVLGEPLPSGLRTLAETLEK